MIDSGKETTYTTKTIVYKLLNLIREKPIRPGDKLPPERELALTMGVSRPILREALKALQVMNIIDIRQGAGAFVRQLEPEKIAEHLDFVFTVDEVLSHDLFEARRVIEVQTARMAARHATTTQLFEIERLMADAAKALDRPEDFMRLDYEIHERISTASGNRILPIFVQSVSKLNHFIREKTNSYPSIREQAVKDHRNVIEALRQHDEDGAAKAMDEHLRNVEKGFHFAE